MDELNITHVITLMTALLLKDHETPTSSSSLPPNPFEKCNLNGCGWLGKEGRGMGMTGEEESVIGKCQVLS